MLRYTFIILILLAAGLVAAQEMEFVCTPCGLECDNKIIRHSGVCESCGKALVEKRLTGNVKNLSVEEVCQRIASNPNLVLLDVRSTHEFNGSAGSMSFGHFKNAININVDQLPSRVSELAKYKDKEVIVYCSHSHRSPRAAYFLSTQGFSNVSNMAGGVSTIKEVNNDCLSDSFVPHRK